MDARGKSEAQNSVAQNDDIYLRPGCSPTHILLTMVTPRDGPGWGLQFILDTDLKSLQRERIHILLV